jgi:hypothetical protein
LFWLTKCDAEPRESRLVDQDGSMARALPDAERGREPLAGLVERVTFHSTETGFSVLRVKVRGHHDGDKVMQIENNYDRDTFNGDIGFVSGIDHEEGELAIGRRNLIMAPASPRTFASCSRPSML